MRTVQQIITFFAILLPLLLLIAIYIRVGTYDETMIVDCSYDGGMLVRMIWIIL